MLKLSRYYTPVNNLTIAPQTSEAQTQVETAIHEALNKPTGTYDSHPSLHDREALVLKIQAAPAAVYWDDPEPAWELLQDVEGLKQEMTTVVQRDVDPQRLTLPEGSSQ